MAQCSALRSDALQLRKYPAASFSESITQAIRLQDRWAACRERQDSAFVQLVLFTGNAYFDTGNYPAAIDHYKRAIRASRNQPQLRSLLLQSYHWLGTSYLYNNQADLAEATFHTVLDNVHQWPGNSLWGGRACLNIAYLSLSNGDYQQAITYAENGQRFAQESRNPALQAQLLREKANALKALTNYKEAVPLIYEAIRLADLAKDLPGLAEYYQLLGDLESKQSQPNAAKIAYKRALVYCEKTGNDFLKALVLTNLGFLHYSQADYAEAINYNQQALLSQKNSFSRARLFNNLGACWWKIGQYNKALKTYQQGFLSMPIGFKDSLIMANPAAQTIRNALRKEVLLTLIKDKADTWLDYAKATASPQRFRHALDTYAVADQMIDFMRWEHTGQQSKLYWRQKTRGLYERAIETCYRLNDTEQAFRFLEKSRAVLLADKLNELGARQKLAPSQIEQEQRLRQAVNDQQNKLAGLSPDSASYASIRGILLSKQDSLDTFLKQLEASNPAYFRYKYDNATTTLAELQRYLKKQSGSLVTYFVGDSALYIMSVTSEKARLRKQSIQPYNQTLSQFATLLASPEAMSKMTNVNRFLTLSHSLYQQLLAPLNLPKGRVVISPDGFFVPFDALSRSGTKPEYAINDYAFSYAYSASLLMKNNDKLARMPRLKTRDFLGIAPVEFSRLGQVMLSGSEVALKPIADRFNSSTMLIRQAATRRAFLTQAPLHRVIHLFTHANADSTDQEPMLYFADSTMRLSDLGDGALPNAELVILAACKTGVGTNQRGEGVFSLARGFSALGVPSVLTTLWSVQNQATYQLTTLFYKYLDEGHPKDIALQRAKQEWLTNAEGINQLPNYWAGLIIVGDTEPLSRTNHWLWIGGVLLTGLVVFGCWLYVQKRPTKLVSA
ncbi:CHAT domain-containing protein [Spirosoma agri]|uniref:CHAT domain-containing protein n=1 Tax=Spirosoma agri TaxID=1987381 RepID=A0A6M0IP62_9BACT|nr:CHAT domain-containing tetratricopeptide repeat protein [Spirosoma agri]NEU69824.1 CHAT domain-containing protein [Spirosoma agri]